MYETITAWRYLFRPRVTRVRLGLLLLGLLVAGLGAGLQYGLGTWEYTGAALLGVGGLLAVLGALLLLFSMFTTVSILAVFLAVGTMVMGRAVTSGFSQEFKDKVLGFNAHVLVMKWGYGLTEYEQVIKEVKQMDQVTGAAPFTIADMLVARGTEHTHVLMKGVLPGNVSEVLDLGKYVRAKSQQDLDRKLARLSQHLDQGAVGPGQVGGCQFKRDEDGDVIPGSRRDCELPGVVIGTRLARRLDAKEGDIIRLISPTAEIQKLRGAETTRGGPPQARDFRVVGLFYCGFEEYDQKLVFVHLKAAQRFLNPTEGPDRDAVLGVEIKLDDIYEAPEVAAAINQRLGGQPYRVITWMQLNKPLFSALRTQRLIFVVIGIVVLGVAAFCILASLYMLVVDKQRQVAILRSMGTSAGGIGRVFLMVSLLIGALGSGLGAGYGLIMSYSVGRLNFPLDPKVYLISRLPVQVDYFEVGLMIASTLALCFVAALYPAFKAAAIRPVDGLRYE